MADIYLDHNATTPLLDSVKDAMFSIASKPLNPSSVHRYGQHARQLVEEARHTVMDSVHAKDVRVIFTSSGTEANNLALRGVQAKAHLVSPTEHVSVLNAIDEAEHLQVDTSGYVDMVHLAERLDALKGTHVLVSVMLANNETGVIQPIGDIVELAHAHGAWVHCDACQAFGKIEVDMDALGVDLLTISSHKIGGPVGAAALVVKKSVLVTPMMRGGSQEHRLRAGTENVMAIIGFAKAITQMDIAAQDEVRLLRDDMEQQLQGRAKDMDIVAKDVARLPNTSLVIMPGVGQDTQLIHFDMEGIAVSAGSACSSGKVEPSYVLKAMGIADETARCGIRVSLHRKNTRKEITSFVDSWCHLYNRHQQEVA